MVSWKRQTTAIQGQTLTLLARDDSMASNVFFRVVNEALLLLFSSQQFSITSYLFKRQKMTSILNWIVIVFWKLVHFPVVFTCKMTKICEDYAQTLGGHTYISFGQFCGFCILYPDFNRSNSFSTGIPGYGEPPETVSSVHVQSVLVKLSSQGEV